MITFIFNVENKHRGDGVADQMEILTRVKGSVDAASASLQCPNHGAGSNASILLRGVGHSYEVKILDSCCEAFREVVKSELDSGARNSVARVVP